MGSHSYLQNMQTSIQYSVQEPSYLQYLIGKGPSFTRAEADKIEKAADYSTGYAIKNIDASAMSDELKAAFDSTENIYDSMIHTFVEGHVKTSSSLQNLVGQDPSYTRAQADEIEAYADVYSTVNIEGINASKALTKFQKAAAVSTEQVINTMIHTYVENHVEQSSLQQGPSYTRAEADKIEANALIAIGLTIKNINMNPGFTRDQKESFDLTEDIMGVMIHSFVEGHVA